MKTILRIVLFSLSVLFTTLSFCEPNIKSCHIVKSKSTEVVALILDDNSEISVDKETYEKYQVGSTYCDTEFSTLFIVYLVLAILFSILFFLSVGCIEIVGVILECILEVLT